ncbi:hypothetical protein ACFQXA_10660 [Nocardiopsis composta]
MTGPSAGGIGSIGGGVGTAVAGVRGPVNVGGTQVNLPEGVDLSELFRMLGETVAEQERIGHGGTITAADVERNGRCFVIPEGFPEVGEDGESPGTLLLTGAPGSGRRGAAMYWLQRASGTTERSRAIRTLPDGGGNGALLLDREAIAPGELLYLDASLEDEDGGLLPRILDELDGYRAAVERNGAWLAVVLDQGQVRTLPHAAREGVVSISRPDVAEVFAAHLGVLGLEPPRGSTRPTGSTLGRLRRRRRGGRPGAARPAGAALRRRPGRFRGLVHRRLRGGGGLERGGRQEARRAAEQRRTGRPALRGRAGRALRGAGVRRGRAAARQGRRPRGRGAAAGAQGVRGPAGGARHRRAPRPPGGLHRVPLRRRGAHALLGRLPVAAPAVRGVDRRVPGRGAAPRRGAHRRRRTAGRAVPAGRPGRRRARPGPGVDLGRGRHDRPGGPGAEDAAGGRVRRVRGAALALHPGGLPGHPGGARARRHRGVPARAGRHPSAPGGGPAAPCGASRPRLPGGRAGGTGPGLAGGEDLRLRGAVLHRFADRLAAPGSPHRRTDAELLYRVTDPGVLGRAGPFPADPREAADFRRALAGAMVEDRAEAVRHAERWLAAVAESGGWEEVPVLLAEAGAEAGRDEVLYTAARRWVLAADGQRQRARRRTAALRFRDGLEEACAGTRRPGPARRTDGGTRA